MAYADITLDTLIETFGLQVCEDSAFVAGFAPAPISALLRQELEENVPLARDISIAKACSEFIAEYAIEQVEQIVGILVGMVREVAGWTVDTSTGSQAVHVGRS
jgi:hypothetical protein